MTDKQKLKFDEFWTIIHNTSLSISHITENPKEDHSDRLGKILNTLLKCEDEMLSWRNELLGIG